MQNGMCLRNFHSKHEGISPSSFKVGKVWMTTYTSYALGNKTLHNAKDLSAHYIKN